MKLKMLLLTSLVCGASMALVGCDHSDKQTTPNNSKEASAPLTSSADPSMMPPTGNQTSTMDVKTKNLNEAEPVEKDADQESSAASTSVAPTSPAAPIDIEKAEPEKTAIDNEPHLSTKTGAEIFATCAACHGEQGQGGVGPKLKGLKKSEVIAKLNAFKAGKSFGPMSSMMIPNAQQLSEEDIKSVAAYIAKL